MSYFLWSKLNYAAFLVFFGYFIILTLNYLFLGIIGLFERKIWGRRQEEEDYPLFYFSTFNLPVSIIVPAHNEEMWIIDSVKSVLNLNYPKFELIIVEDGSTDKTFELLDNLFNFKSIDLVYTHHYKTGRINDILKSVKYPNVTVVRKEPGQKKAGAVNAGLNIARHDYVCVMDADTVLEQDSLLKVMAQINKDPERIIAVGSYFGLANGLKIKDGVILEKSFSFNPIVAYQNLEYIRSFIGVRGAWSKYNGMPNVAGGFGVWRRDIMYKLGGYSAEHTCEDIELTFRAHKFIVDNKEKEYKIMMLPYNAAWTEGPDNTKALLLQRNRWQRVVIEVVLEHKHMLFNPKYGAFGCLTLPYYALYEVAGVYFEFVSAVYLISGWLLKLLDTSTFLAYFIFMIACQVISSLIALFSFIRAHKIFDIKYTLYLVFLTLVEFLYYRWLLTIAKISGTISYMRGIRVYDQYDRGKRS